MEIGLVRPINIDEEMQQSYLDYAMSVIVSRALPDARDGLKPVHRRILYAMYDMGMRADTRFKKSARIVGEVLGKYHPHGDMAVYDAMVRMAQEFSMRYPLVEGQGNFGSVDGDPPAAMRYTETRLAPTATHMLADIKKETVDFSPNFDDTLDEPDVLPAALPNMLVNGATGIAVGMSTSIPPHNLGEVVDALTFMLERWTKLDDISLEDLMRFIKGPDFPTGGLIIQEADEDNLTKAYGSGRGRVTVRARVHVEEMSRGRHRIIVTELPFMTNKSSLVARIANLSRQGKLEGLADLRDESDRQGMRILIELTKTADPYTVLRELYKRTPMQSTFSIIMLALVLGEPRMLSLKQALRVYLEHRLVVIRRRSEHDLSRAHKREHILAGLRIALKNLDEIINLIRRSRTVDTARTNLMRRYHLTEIQAQAILDMPLRRLASLERKKIEQEFKEVRLVIRSLTSLLRSPLNMRQSVIKELRTVKETYGDRRRTRIVRIKEGEAKTTALTATDLTPERMVWIVGTPDGLVSRTLEDKAPRLSGRDAPGWLLRVNTRDTLYLVSGHGVAAALPVHALPEVVKPSEGKTISKVSPLSAKEKLAAVFTLPQKSRLAKGWFVVTSTRGGMIKKTAVEELPGPTAGTFTLVKVNQGDKLGWINLSKGNEDILLVTARGMAIRFSEGNVRPMGLVAAGVMGIKLQIGDEVVGSALLPQRGEVFLMASNGKAKRVTQVDFPLQGRYGQGVVAWKLPQAVRLVGITVGKGTTRVILHLVKYAAKSIRLDEAPLLKRGAMRGKSILNLRAGDRLLGITIPWNVPRPLTKSTKARKTVQSSRPKRKTPPTKSKARTSPPSRKKTSRTNRKPRRK